MRHLQLLFCWLFLPAVALAQGSVDIRSPSQLEISSKKTPFGTVVVVRLEDNLSKSLDSQFVSLTLTPLDGMGGSYAESRAVYSGEAEFPLEELLRTRQLRFTSYRAKAVFSGNSLYEPAEAESQIDISKDTPSIEIEATSELSLTEKEAIFIARVSFLGAPINNGAIELSGLKKTLRDDLNEAGEVTFTFPPTELPREGPNTLIVKFLGNDLFNAVETRRPMSLVAPVTVVLRGPSSVAADEDLELTGSLQTPRGPLAKKGVALFAQIAKGEERSLGNTVTDAEGNFEIAIAAKVFKKSSTVQLIARFTPDAPWLRPGESPLLACQVLPARPVPPAFYLVPLFVCGAVALGMFFLRATRQRAIEKPTFVKPKTGLVLSNRNSIGPEELSFSGRVQNAKTQELIEGATLWLQYGDSTSLEMKTDASGKFLFAEMSRGKPSLSVRAHGFVSESFTLEIPHRGKYRDITVALLPVREKVLEIFREVAMQVLPEANHWGTWTPREIRRYAREKKYHVKGPIGELVLLFESVYFAGVIGDETTIEKANALANEARVALEPTTKAA